MKSEASITKPHHLKSVASWQFQLGCKLFANGLPRATLGQTLKLSSRGNGPVGSDMSCAKAARPVTI